MWTAPTGQAARHRPHVTQAAAATLALSPRGEIARTGHASAQSPQRENPTQRSAATVATGFRLTTGASRKSAPRLKAARVGTAREGSPGGVSTSRTCGRRQCVCRRGRAARSRHPHELEVEGRRAARAGPRAQLGLGQAAPADTEHRPRGTGCAQTLHGRARTLAQLVDDSDGCLREARTHRASQLVEIEPVAGEIGAEQDRRPRRHSTGVSRARRSIHSSVTRASAA